MMQMRYTVISVLIAGWAAALAAAQEPTGARGLFYDPQTGKVTASPATVPVRPNDSRVPVVRPVTPIKQARAVGVHYWVELDGVGTVTDSRVFLTGDRIRLHVRSNIDGFLSVWSFDPDGRGQLLLPVKGETEGTPVAGAQDYVSPFIRFQPPASDERLVLFFATRRSQLPSPSILGGDKVDLAALVLGASGARALVVEVEEQRPSEIGTYVVNRDGGPISREIRLRHVDR